MAIAVYCGEGPTDLGKQMKTSDFTPGPIHALLEKMAIESGKTWPASNKISWKKDQFFTEENVKKLISDYENTKMNSLFRSSMFMPGKDEERLFPAIARQAMGLGLIAQKEQSDLAVFFRDSDANDYMEVRCAIRNGFKRANFPHGLPIVPEPTSEAWILCAKECGTGCNKFFDLSGTSCKADTPADCAGGKDWTVKAKPAKCCLACPNICPKRSYEYRYDGSATTKAMFNDIAAVDVTTIKARSFRVFSRDFGNIVDQL